MSGKVGSLLLLLVAVVLGGAGVYLLSDNDDLGSKRKPSDGSSASVGLKAGESDPNRPGVSERQGGSASGTSDPARVESADRKPTDPTAATTNPDNARRSDPARNRDDGTAYDRFPEGETGGAGHAGSNDDGTWPSGTARPNSGSGERHRSVPEGDGSDSGSGGSGGEGAGQDGVRSSGVPMPGVPGSGGIVPGRRVPGPGGSTPNERGGQSNPSENPREGDQPAPPTDNTPTAPAPLPAPTQVRVAPPSTSVLTIGAPFTLTAAMDMPEAMQTTVMQFELHYPADVLRYNRNTEPQLVNMQGASKSVTVNESAPGVLKVLIMGLNVDVIKSGSGVQVVFDVLSSKPTSWSGTITASSVVAGSAQGVKHPTEGTSGILKFGS